MDTYRTYASSVSGTTKFIIILQKLHARLINSSFKLCWWTHQKIPSKDASQIPQNDASYKWSSNVASYKWSKAVLQTWHWAHSTDLPERLIPKICPSNLFQWFVPKAHLTNDSQMSHLTNDLKPFYRLDTEPILQTCNPAVLKDSLLSDSLAHLHFNDKDVQ